MFVFKPNEFYCTCFLGKYLVNTISGNKINLVSVDMHFCIIELIIALQLIDRESNFNYQVKLCILEICIVEKKKKEKKKREKNEAYQRSLQRIIALRNHSKL